MKGGGNFRRAIIVKVNVGIEAESNERGNLKSNLTADIQTFIHFEISWRRQELILIMNDDI